MAMAAFGGMPLYGAANSRIGMPAFGNGLSIAAFSAVSSGSFDAFVVAAARPRGAT